MCLSRSQALVALSARVRSELSAETCPPSFAHPGYFACTQQREAFTVRCPAQFALISRFSGEIRARLERGCGTD